MNIDKNCKECNSNFKIKKEDLEFYNKISPVINGKRYQIPVPEICPQCREKRRWSFRNESKLYKRKCDYSGKPMISLYSPNKPFKVFKEEIWWSDKWSALDYGRKFDFERPFFEQFSELMHSVPRRGMHQDGTNENCEYTTFGMGNKDCYYSFTCFYCQNTYYTSGGGGLKDSMDCLVTFEGELLYECIDCKKCYNCDFCRDSENCIDSILLYECKDCRNCIACKNLRKKEFYIYNKPVSKEEFENYRKNIKRNLIEEQKKFYNWSQQLPVVANHIKNSENCTGDYIEFAKNCHDCYYILDGAEDCKFCFYSGSKGKDMMDCCNCGLNSELVYEMHATANANNCAFVSFCRNCSNIYYCDCISSSNYCFGCSGLNRHEYCILNKQYSKEDYFKLVAKIIEHMQKTDEWGQFFPTAISPFKYEETVANLYFPN